MGKYEEPQLTYVPEFQRKIIAASFKDRMEDVVSVYGLGAGHGADVLDEILCDKSSNELDNASRSVVKSLCRYGAGFPPQDLYRTLREMACFCERHEYRAAYRNVVSVLKCVFRPQDFKERIVTYEEARSWFDRRCGV